MLVASGHSFDDVLNRYTVAQLQMFGDLCGKRRLNEFKANAVAVHVATQGTKKDWQKFINNLKPRDGQKPGETPADSLLRQLGAFGLWHSPKTLQSGSG